MQGQRRPAPESAYASQAARWKQGFKPAQQQAVPQHQTDLENALVSELCSSVGSSSFPPRDVLHKLLRYLHTLDHDYICELLDDKFESPLWQVQAKALSVLSALLASGEADFYKQYYSGRLDLLEELCHARKDMLRKRADKVYVVLKDYVPSDEQTPLDLMRRGLEQQAEGAALVAPGEVHAFMRTSPVVTSAQTPQELMASMNDSPRSSSAPLPGPGASEVSAFSFLAHQPQQEYPPAPRAANPLTPPVSGSAFGFLSTDGDEMQALPQAADPAPGGSAFSFMTGSPPRNPTVATPLTSGGAVLPPMPVPSAPPMPSAPSGFSFLNASPAANSVHAIEHGIPSSSTSEMPSAFAFLGAQRQPQTQQAASAIAPGPMSSMPLPHHPHSVFDALPAPSLQPQQPRHVEEREVKEEEPAEPSDPIHDAFEGMDADDGAQALDSFDAYNPSTAGQGGYADSEDAAAQPTQSSEPLREVILEIEVPPGPMGVMLDRTILDMTVIERFVPLPTGGRGYLELHPAICPGCALLSINSIYVENKGLAEVGPILASLAATPKLLRFKKLMNNGRTANPSTLMMPYIPPPLEEEDVNNTDEEATGDERDARYHPDAEHVDVQGSAGGDALMSQLDGYSSGLSAIEAKLNEIILREHAGQHITDRRNQLAQLHGTVEKIQTQGIDAVILGPNPPPNYEEVKQFRSTLVRKADELARRIQKTVHGEPQEYEIGGTADEEKHPVSAFAFVGGDTNSTVNDPPLALSQLRGDSGFQFLNANANPQVADIHGGNILVPPATEADASYGFSFLRENAQPQPEVTPSQFRVSQAPTSPSSSFGALPTECGASSAMDAATSVFAGLSVKDTNLQPQARAPPALSDTFSGSSHGRPMGLSDLELSMRSTASGAPVRSTSSMPMAMAPPPIPTAPTRGPVAATDSPHSSFGFMSTINATEQPVFESSTTSTEPSSPTAFGFLRGGASSSTTTAASSATSQPQTQRSFLQVPEPSMFSFISN